MFSTLSNLGSLAFTFPYFALVGPSFKTRLLKPGNGGVFGTLHADGEEVRKHGYTHLCPWHLEKIWVGDAYVCLPEAKITSQWSQFDQRQAIQWKFSSCGSLAFCRHNKLGDSMKHFPAGTNGVS